MFVVYSLFTYGTVIQACRMPSYVLTSNLLKLQLKNTIELSLTTITYV